MELDSKQKVLVAIYTEYQKDIPDITSVTPESLGMDDKVFYVALQKLENENLIRDVRFYMGMTWSLQITKMTNYGLKYVEEKLGIQPTMSGSEKVKEVMKKAGEFGFDQIKDFGAKVLAELIKS